MRLCLPVVLALLWMPAPAAAQDPKGTPQNEPVIVATGSAEVRRAPDRAWVEIQVMSRAKDPKEAQRQNADAMSKVMDQLKAMNLGAGRHPDDRLPASARVRLRGRQAGAA